MAKAGLAVAAEVRRATLKLYLWREAETQDQTSMLQISWSVPYATGKVFRKRLLIVVTGDHVNEARS